jgi:hypothetical protein
MDAYRNSLSGKQLTTLGKHDMLITTKKQPRSNQIGRSRRGWHGVCVARRVSWGNSQWVDRIAKRRGAVGMGQPAACETP